MVFARPARFAPRVWLVVGLVSAVSAPGPAQAQSWPVKPVRMIAPFPPGGSSDVLTRIVAQKLGEGLGRQVVVENRPGAASNIGHEYAARQPADGYTLLLTNIAAMVTNQFLYKKLPFDPYNDFSPISIVATSAPILVVHPSVPVKSVKELIALARGREGKLNYGSGGVGTTAHIIGELFQSTTGVRMVHVPYKGGVLAVNDLVAGQIDLGFTDMVPTVPHVKSGRLRPLAVTSERRSNALPEVPTMREAGFNAILPTQWWAVTSPRGTPAAVISRVNAEIGQMMKAPDVQERYAAMGIFPAHTTPERVTEMMKESAKIIGAVVSVAGMKPE